MFTRYKKSPVISVYEEALRSSKTVNAVYPISVGDPLPFTRLRASSLPICSILQYLKLQKEHSTGLPERKVTAISEYFTQIGTAVHTVLQRWMGLTGKILGNWKCPSCGHKEKMTVYKDCPSCGEEMVYVEIKVKYKTLSGHVDGVLVLPNKKMIVLDYKTTTSSKIDKNSPPLLAYEKQLSSYAYLLKSKYHLPVVGSSLLYVSRDNPFKYKEYPLNLNNMKKFLDEQVYRQRVAEDTVKTEDLEALIQSKPCSSREFYLKDMHSYEECPLLNVCFGDELLPTLDKYRRTLEI